MQLPRQIPAHSIRRHILRHIPRTGRNHEAPNPFRKLPAHPLSRAFRLLPSRHNSQAFHLLPSRHISQALRLFPALCLLLVTIAGGTHSSAVLPVEDRLAEAVVFRLNQPVAMVANTLIRIDATSRNVKPFAETGRTLLPVRFLAEALGADVQWLGTERTAVVTAGGTTLRIPLDTLSMEVNGTSVPLDIPARITDGRILVPMRALCEALGREVDWHPNGLILVSHTRNLLDEVVDASALQALAARFDDPFTYDKREIKTTSGIRTVHVTTIRPGDPRVRFEVALPDTLLNHTADFVATAKAKGARVAIDGNFFTAYSDIKDPIGHVMINGELIYGQSGITSMGITRSKQVFFGQPGIFTRLFADGVRTNRYAPGGQVDYSTWVAYEVNTRSQSATNAIVYTPRRGSEIAFTASGHVVTVRNNAIAALSAVASGTTLPIPAEGYLVFFGESVTKDWIGDWDLTPGRPVELEHYLFSNPGNPFPLEDMQWMLSGGPDLVTNGAASPVSTSLTFSDTRFTTASTSRTAVGVTADGRLVLVSTPSAKISDMKEIMLSLGCSQAINLDGGGSTGLYVDGNALMTPGRALATMFFVYDW